MSIFLTVFTKENMHDMPNNEQMFRADENEKLTDISITREIDIFIELRRQTLKINK